MYNKPSDIASTTDKQVLLIIAAEAQQLQG